MTTKFPCGICAKAVAENCNAICREISNLWVHIRCNNITMALSKVHKQVLKFSKLTYSQLRQNYKRKFFITSKEKNPGK